MKIYLLLCSIFIISALSKADDRTVNVAIETSFQFEPKDINDDKGFVTNIKSFIDKIYHSLEPSAVPILRATQEDSFLSIFLEKFGKNLLNLTDADIHDIAKTLYKQFQYYKASSPSFQDIFSDPILKKYVKKMVRDWSQADAKELKTKLHKLLNVGNPDLHKLLNQLNTYYTEQDVQLFNQYTNKLIKYLRKNKNVSDLIKEWLDFSIFDRYNLLNDTLKSKVKNAMRLLSYYFDESKFKARADGDTSLLSHHLSDDVSGDGVNRQHEHSHILKLNRKLKRQPKAIKDKRYDENVKNSNTLELIKKFLKSDVLGNFDLQLRDEKKNKD